MGNTNDQQQVAQVLNSKPGRFAMLALYSGEQIIISVGTATAKVVMKHPIFGWYFPKTIASERLATWQPEYEKYSNLHRNISRKLVLDGLIKTLSSVRSIEEIRQVWLSIKNPIVVVGRDLLCS